MKKISSLINTSSGPWIILLVISDIFFALLLWTSSGNNYKKYITVIVLFSIISIAVAITFQIRNYRKLKKCLSDFIENPDPETEAFLIAAAGPYWKDIVEKTCFKNLKMSQGLSSKTNELSEYKDFIEAWAHEIKTPLSLAMLVLDNHSDEMSPYVRKRIEHVRHCVSSDVDRILYYARLNCVHPDYKFEKTDLKETVNEVLMNFSGVSEEKKILTELLMEKCFVQTDKRIISFMISQLISNAFKYCDDISPLVKISISKPENSPACLSIYNNTKTTAEEDMPFIFDKGFTGDSSQRNSATGMGLYFVKKFAELLCINVDAQIRNVDGNTGFEVMMYFQD